MGQPFKFCGSSDDTFGCVGQRGDDYDNCASGKPIVWRISDPSGSLLVWGQYAPDAIGSGSWVVGVAADDGDLGECAPFPAWPISIIPSDRDYSPLLVIEAPTAAVLTRLFPKAA